MKIHQTFILALFLFISNGLLAIDYHVGPDEDYSNINDVPWESLTAGDRIYIHYRPAPYFEKWVINAAGTEDEPIEIIGVLGPDGQKPIIDGDGATTRTELNYWGENRGIIKIGGSSIPTDGLPSYINIENLEVRSGRPAYSFTNDAGAEEIYASNCASIYIEKGEHITIRNCDIHDSGNGIFIGSFDGETKDILISGNHIYNNGIVDSFYEHNTYTSATGIIYEYNRFGPLREGALGNNLKDRSAGLVVRYNWIESGNRQLDMVDAYDSEALLSDPSYATTYVYGNILIEPDGAGNSQVLHYGGDSGTLAAYRKGTLYFYNNTIISTRSRNTTLARLSSADETMTAFNNVIYNTAAGSNMALMNEQGTLNIKNNWMPTGWVDSHGAMTGTINDLGDNLDGTDPMFTDFASQDFSLMDASLLIDAGQDIPTMHLPNHALANEYVKHTQSAERFTVGAIDLGAFENTTELSLETFNVTNLILYPNPAQIFLTVDASDFKSISIYAITGQCVMETRTNKMDVRNLKPGVYILQVRYRDHMEIGRFVKE